MMLKFEASVIINRPVEEVFEYYTNPENNTQWQVGALESKKTSEGPFGVGTTVSSVTQFLGRRIKVATEVTEHEPNRKSSIKSTSGPFPLEGTTTFESSASGTKVKLVGQADVGGFFKLAEPLVRRQTERQWNTNLATLKDLLEAQG